MAPNPPGNDNPLWAYAARTVQANAAEQDIRQLALRHHREALRQYLALRLGTEEDARTALAEIGVEVDGWPSDRLNAPPGPRAHLFAMARRLVKQRGTLLAPQASAVLPMQNGSHARAALAKLPPEHLEVLELHHARELSAEEIAHVLEEPASSVQERISAAQLAAEEVLGLPGPADVMAAAARTFALKADPQAGHEDNTKPLQPGTVIGERYTVDKAVGIGAFGQVYRASDNFVPGHTVALKLLHQPTPEDDQRNNALRELRLIASVFHPSIVSFKDHGWYHERLWFVMPWYDGESLEDRMLRKPLSRQEAATIFLPLANALASMHAAGVRHQDIKPENILLAQLKTDPLGADQLQPVLLDLGVAATDAESIVAGTPAYFAPEVAGHYVGEPDPAPISDKADVFSLALALRNALEPHTQVEVQGSAITLFIAMRAEEPPGPPTGKEFSFLRPHFKRWLAKDPELRPTAAQFATELEVLLEPERRAQRRSAFLSWFVPTTAGFLVVLAVGAFIWSQQMRESEQLAHAAELQLRSAKQSAVREAALRKDLEQQNGVLQDEQARTSQARDDLAEALEQTESHAKQLSTRARSLARERSKTEQTLEQTAAELADSNAKADELSTNTEQLETQLEDGHNRIAELQAQTRALDELLKETHVLLQAEQHKAELLRAKLDQAEKQLNSERERAERLQSERDKTQKSVETLQSRVEKRDTALLKARNELEAANKRVTKLEKQAAKNAPAAKGPPKSKPAAPEDEGV